MISSSSQPLPHTGMENLTYPAPNNGAFSYKEEPLADWTLARPGPA